MRIELYLNTDSTGMQIKMDMYPDESIVLKRNIYNEDGLSNSNANFTKDFMLPATNNNNLAFGHYEVKSNANTHNPAKKIEARIGIVITPAQNLGAIILAMGLTAIISIADNCSVAFISPISAVIAVPALPANKRAVTTGPNSLTNDNATNTPIASDDPYFWSV
jgi:hypothetical protein